MSTTREDDMTPVEKLICDRRLARDRLRSAGIRSEVYEGTCGGCGRIDSRERSTEEMVSELVAQRDGAEARVREHAQAVLDRGQLLAELREICIAAGLEDDDRSTADLIRELVRQRDEARAGGDENAQLAECRAHCIRAGFPDDGTPTELMVMFLVRQRDEARSDAAASQRDVAELQTKLREVRIELSTARQLMKHAGIPTSDAQLQRRSTPQMVQDLVKALGSLDKALLEQIRAAAWPDKGDRQPAPESPTTQAGTGSEGDRLDDRHEPQGNAGDLRDLLARVRRQAVDAQYRAEWAEAAKLLEQERLILADLRSLNPLL